MMMTLAIQLEESTRNLLAERAARQHISLEEFARRLLIDEAAICNAETISAMDDIEHHRNLVGPFHSVNDLMRDLNA